MSNSNGRHCRKERITEEPPIETLPLAAGASPAPVVVCSTKIKPRQLRHPGDKYQNKKIQMVRTAL
jgi:hypothetical protein